MPPLKSSEPDQSHGSKFILWLGATILLLSIGLSYASRQSDPNAAIAPDLRADDISYKLAAKKLVQAKLRDPSSAEFSAVEFHPSRPGKSAIICGLVNARNGFGGMTGPQRFIVGGTTAIESDVDPAQFQEAWSTLC